jgi:acyl-CoA hydrolase
VTRLLFPPSRFFHARCAYPAGFLHDKIMSAPQAALLIKDGMTIGISGFGGAGDATAVSRP